MFYWEFFKFEKLLENFDQSLKENYGKFLTLSSKPATIFQNFSYFPIRFLERKL